MITDKLRVYDGYSGLAGGQDAGRRPSLIDKTQCERADNFVFRGGAPTTRPGIIKLTSQQMTDVQYTDDGIPGPGDGSQVAFDTAIFQTAGYYSYAGLECFIVSVGGRLFQAIPRETEVEISEFLLPSRNRSTLPRAWMVQADLNHITQDGEGGPLIFNGATMRRATKDEIFTGTIMAYGQGRIVLIKERRIFFGDIFDGKGNGADDALGFTETRFLNEGFASALPSLMGAPTGAAFFPQQDTSTGTGDLLVFGEHGAESFFLSLPRSTWKDSTFQQTALLGIGAQGDRSIIIVNGDLWFRSSDGWRSYRQARAQIDQWSQVPLSTGVRTYTDVDTESLLEYGSAVHFDNRMIMTCTPQPNSGRLFHNGLLALDFDVLSAFGRTGMPAWDGHWTSSIQVFQIISGKFAGRERSFIFGFYGGRNTIFEITKSEVRDFSGPIPWELRTRSMDFDSEFNEKELYGADIWVDDVLEPAVNAIGITAQYRADQKPDYTDWGTFKTLSASGTPGAITPGMVPTLDPGYWPRKSLGIPPDSCDSILGRIDRRGYEFQAKLNGTGHCCIRKFRMHAKQLIEAENSECV